MTETAEPSREKWVCPSCSWVYDPAEGFYDSEAGVAYDPYTPWEALPDTVICPSCGTSKTAFTKVEEPDA